MFLGFHWNCKNERSIMEAKEIFKNESVITPEKEWSEQRNLITPSQLKMEMHKTGKQKM